MDSEIQSNGGAQEAGRSSLHEVLADDTQWRCTACGRIGTVGRCCGLDTRIPLNELARQEEQRIKSANADLSDRAGDGGRA